MPTSPSTPASGTDSTILTYLVRGLRERGAGLRRTVVRGLHERGAGLRHIVDLSSELIGLSYELSRHVIRISAFLVFPTPMNNRASQPEEYRGI